MCSFIKEQGDGRPPLVLSHPANQGVGSPHSYFSPLDGVNQDAGLRPRSLLMQKMPGQLWLLPHACVSAPVMVSYKSGQCVSFLST